MKGLAPAFSFLTRFGPAKVYSTAELGASLRFFPLVGLVVGLLSLAPVLLPRLADNPLVAASLGVGVSLWATRLLHADGLADILDAVGSNATGEAFFAIMKDSRCGAFAVAGVCVALVLQISCLAALIGHGQALAAVFAFALARALSSELATSCRPIARSGLGSTILADVRPADLWGSRVLTCACAVLTGSVPVALAMLAAAALACLALRRLALKQGGFSGDFWGAAIVCGETCALLGAVLAG